MLQPKKPNSDKLLKDLYKKQQSLEKIDEENQFKSNYTPQSLKYQKQRKYLNDKKSEIKTDNSTNKDKEFNKDIYDQKEWDDKKWGYAEDAASIAELGNFVPHPAAQVVGKVGAAASATLSARKAKLAYDNEDYVNMGLNLGMMGVSAGLGSKTLSRSTPKLSKLDSFEKAIAPKSFKSNVINGHEVGRITSDIPSYINVLNQKSGQSAGNLLLNRGALGAVGVDLNTDFSTEQNKNTQYAMGGNLNINMNRYAQGGDLTQFNTGGTHESSPIGGVPIGNNNSVEQGETKQNNFIYSNRIFLDSNIISQYNLPKSLIGKSVADATKMIDDKFKGRNDKISQSTKNGMLSKIAEAQEAMKPQEPEMEQPQESMEQSQMAYGGSTANRYESGQQLGDTFVNGAAVGADMIMPGSGQILKLGDQLGQTVGQEIGGNKGESIGGLISPLGTIRGLGSALKTGNINDIPGVGIFGGKTTKQKLALENANNSALNANNQFSDKYAFGGPIDPPTKITKTNLVNTPIIQGVNPSVQSDRFRYAVGEQGGVQHGTSGKQGHYLYYGKKPGDAGFNPAIHREFVNQGGYDTYMRSPQGQQYRRNLSTQSLQPIEQLGYGGKVKKMADGGYYDKNNPYFMMNPGSINMGPNPAPTESILQQSGLKPVGTTVPYTIATQPQVDISNANRQFTSGPSNLDMLKYNAGKVGSYVNDNIGNLARYAPIAANALQLSQLKKPQGERLDRLSNRYKPEYVDEAQLQNIADQNMNNTVSAISQSGASQGQTRASILGSQLQRTKALSDAYSQAAAQNRTVNDRAQTFNLGVDQVNLQQSNTEKDINARDQAAYRNAKREYITGIGEGIGDVGKEQTQKKIIAKTLGYKWDGEYVKNPDGTVVTDPDTGKPMTGEKLKELQSTKDKKALGGYLIKNKTK